MRQVLMVGVDDPVIPARARDAYVAAAVRAGDAAEVVTVPGSHFEIIAPASAAFSIVRDRILELLK